MEEIYIELEEELGRWPTEDEVKERLGEMQQRDYERSRNGWHGNGS